METHAAAHVDSDGEKEGAKEPSDYNSMKAAAFISKF